MEDTPQPQTYEILIGSPLDDEWTAWFDGFQVRGGDDVTLLRGAVADQSALHGLLARIRDLAMPLLEVRRIPTDRAPDAVPGTTPTEEE